MTKAELERALKRAEATAKREAAARRQADRARDEVESAQRNAVSERDALGAQLADALDQQTATSEILRVISNSPTDAQPVFDAIAESARRLLDGHSSALWRLAGEVVHLAAFTTTGETGDADLRARERRPLDRVRLMSLAIRDRRPLAVADVETDPVSTPEVRAIGRARGFRAILIAPLLRRDQALGAISVTRREPGPFREDVVRLLQTFADQAVIAIENVRLFTELQENNRALTEAHARVTEALEQQTATSEILNAISGSPTDAQPVFDAIARNAVRVCGGVQCGVFRFDGERLHFVAHNNFSDEGLAAVRAQFPRAPGRDNVGARSVLERRVIHVPDLEADVEAGSSLAIGRAHGYRSLLAVPMLREGQAVGFIGMGKASGGFTDREIDLLKTFADQAVIAIENVRLFTELQEKNRALTQALDEQTATGNILRVISGSPTDIRPVFQAIMDSAARLLRAHSGAVTRVVEDRIELAALTASDEAAEAVLKANYPMTLDSGTSHALTIQSRRPFNVHDSETDPRLTEAGRRTARARGYRSQLVVPMLRHDQPLGAISLTRREPGGFKDEEIALLQTFADQAVIAIENVRLFTELQQKNRAVTEALEQQTAMSDILRVIASSSTDLTPVFDAICRSAVRLFEAYGGAITRFDGALVHLAAVVSPNPEADVRLRRQYPQRPDAGAARDRAILERAVVHIPDTTADSDYMRNVSRDFGYQRTLAVPMLRDGQPIGSIVVTGHEPGPYSERQIELLKTFADQAVIAIENARLFTELQEKNSALTEAHARVTEALDQQTATAEILKAISSSPSDTVPVFETIAASAVRLCGGAFGAVFRFDGNLVHLAAQDNFSPDALGAFERAYPAPLSRDNPLGRSIADGRTVHIVDMEQDGNYSEPAKIRAAAIGYRALLAVPMVQMDRPIGAIAVGRREPGGFANAEIELLKTFADQAIIAIENVRLFTELQQRTHDLSRSVDQLTALSEVSRAVSSTLDLDRVLNTVVTRASQLAEADGGSIYEYDDAARGFRMRATSQVSREVAQRQRDTVIPAGEGAVGQLVERRAPVQIPDIAEEPAYRSPLRDVLMGGGYRALLAVPMIQEDAVVGGLVVSRKAPGEFPAETVELLQTFANQSALAIANARLFREIEEKSVQLEAANQHKSEFLANMSHELRTPLNAVIGFSDVLLEGMFGEINEKQTEYLRDILSSGTHLLSLINDILDLSKIEAGRMELDLSDFDVPSAIGNALTLMRERASRHGITLTHVVDSGLGEIRADERKFKQVLLNLLSNAVKFTPEGGRVEVRARLVDGAVEVAVADTGEGIAPEDQQAVFEEFRQVGKSSKKIEGTGLGLALCRKFVELHGGALGLESQVGVGSTFTFTIPCRVHPQ